VCMKGTLRGGEIRGSEAREALFGLVVDAVAWLLRLSRRGDLFRLWRDVRLSSRGFKSGGRLEILRKMRARYMSMKSETKWIPPLTTLMRNREKMIL